MKTLTYIALFTLLFLEACAQNTDQNNTQTSISAKTNNLILPEGTIIQTRFNLPKGYTRIASAKNTFAAYLQNLPLKPNGTSVKYYNGQTKTNPVYHAVVDLEIGKRDLHQCADAVMRLKAEYHWNKKEYDQIHFNFTNGFRVDYSEWMKGKRIKVKGNKTSWVASAKPSYTYKNFWKYMEIVFSYAGTLSLSKELKSVKLEHMQIGDIFIQGGSPGHAIIVVDMATNKKGQQVFMLAQSYMPAQELQILKNPSDWDTPWYTQEFGEVLKTPEWSFSKSDLKRFAE